MDNTSLLVAIGIPLLLFFIFIVSRLKDIDNSIKEIKAKTPFTPCGIHKHQDILIGTCPQCREMVTNVDNPYECNNCFQRLNWNTNEKGDKRENN